MFVLADSAGLGDAAAVELTGVGAGIVAYKGQGLPRSSALDFAQRLQEVACTSSR